jgi:hypothetical protein
VSSSSAWLTSNAVLLAAPGCIAPLLLHCCLIPAAAAAASQQKKPKKQAAAAGKKQLAVVGDAQLAATRPPLVRALYNEHPEVAAMSQQQVQELHEQRRTAVEGCALRPVVSFEQTGLPANMLHATRDFVTPSPIQSQCWPIILSGHDMIGIAATGSGKTLAFGLPMLRHIQAQREGGVVTGKGPVALVMAPTRELALQIAAVLEDAGSKCGIGSVCVYGGVPKHPQVSALRSGVDIVVGTPGRLEDLMQDGACKLQVRACGCCRDVAQMRPVYAVAAAVHHVQPGLSQQAQLINIWRCLELVTMYIRYARVYVLSVMPLS